MAIVGLKILQSDKQIAAMIAREMKLQLNSFMIRATPKIESRIRRIVGAAIRRQPEYASLNNGQLAKEFGLVRGRESIEEIIDIWLSNIKMTVKPPRVVGGVLGAGITIEMIKSDYSDVLTSPAGRYITQKGSIINWLEWLLKFGDRRIIREYEVRVGSNSRQSRTGAIMVQRVGGSWGVPSEFAGTPRNNFVTRALADIEDDIVITMERELKN